MIINNFHVIGVSISPDETYPPLVVDAKAPLPDSGTSQRLESIARRNPQIFKFLGCVQYLQFSGRCLLDGCGRAFENFPLNIRSVSAQRKEAIMRVR
jgi:hypothetical protein